MMATTQAIHGNVSDTSFSQSGYDLEVYDNGHFYGIHLSALLCILISFLCAVTVTIASFTKRKTNFFTWSKSDRFVVYIAICDSLFNIAHSLDHTHVLVTKSHVKPKQLCAFYGFILSEFLSAQIFMINLVAINAFCLMFFNKDIPFGKWDHRLLIWTFGAPLLASIVAVSLNQFGPNTVFCFMDAIRGKLMNTVYLTIPLLIVFSVNLVLYGLTYWRLKVGATKFKGSRMSSRTRRVARNMILFLLAFFVQYWAAALFGAYQLFTDDIPTVIYYFLTTFTNIGGFLNGLVYIVIRRRFLHRDKSGEKTSVDRLNRSGDASPSAMRHIKIKKQEGDIVKSKDNILSPESSSTIHQHEEV
ncbi:uncharacterized protein LOC110444268 [Mizuhopecten yessoensis]|uniref:G-protein coupled receptors family 1 profile domain-containing protein n=1 Tax=Mizuhopecten yessoensis TaxID=6573 RepID=A0A210R0G4_MIZYE|nr:uncharacterized protein LOC110444268 [Mizuhopecten yessoensis]OWF54513.1 hypothetical protein KP79_PYT10826 [Mizuhopecten yessoensis]